MTLQEQWHELITECWQKSRGEKAQLSKSRLFLFVLAHRLGLQDQTMVRDNSMAIFGDVIESVSNQSLRLAVPSISEIEELYQALLDPGLRSGTGSYYTPENLAKMMVTETLRTHYRRAVSPVAQPHFPLDHPLVNEALTACDTESEQVLDEQVKWYESLRILDLSCGSGVFLRQSLMALVALAHRIYHGRGKDMEAILYEALESKITGIEFQEDACMLAKLLIHVLVKDLLVGVAGHHNRMISDNIFCHDALKWDPEKTKTTSHRGYTVVLGNPPYLGEKGNTAVFAAARSTLWGQRHYEKNMDFFYYFIHKGLDLLAEDGVMCYVTTNYFSTADGAKKLRARIQEESQVHWMINPEKVTLFPHARGQHNLIFCLGQRANGQRPSSCALWNNTQPLSVTDFCQRAAGIGAGAKHGGVDVTFFPDASKVFDQRGQLLVRSPGSRKAVLDKLVASATFQLQDLCTINQGVVSGADKMTQKHEKALGFPGRDQGIFVLNEQEKKQLLSKDKRLATILKPFYKNSQIGPYKVPETPDQWLLYITDEQVPDLGWSQALADHLEPFKPILSQRREVQMGVRQWYSLHWPRKQHIFEMEKIVAPQRAKMNLFGFTRQSWYASADVYFIQRRETCFLSWEYLLLWLNSALCYAWLTYYGKMKGKDLELYATPLKQIPLLAPPNADEEKWMLKAYDDIRLNLGDQTKLRQLQRQVDERFFQWLEVNEEDSLKLTNQLENLREKT